MTVTDILLQLTEMAHPNYVVPPSQAIRTFAVDYYVITPKGSRSRFRRVCNINAIRLAKSETAVYFYLKRIHPGTEIQIQDVEFR